MNPKTRKTGRPAGNGRPAPSPSRGATRKAPPPPDKAGLDASAPRPAEAAGLLTLDEAVALLKTTRPTFYRWLRAGRLKGMKVGRQWRFHREDVDRFLAGQQPKAELRGDIRPLLHALDRRLADLGCPAEPAGEAPPVRQAVKLMLRLGIEANASDLHVDPYHEQAAVRLRIDGVLHPSAEFDIRLLPGIAEEIKRMAACDVLQKALPQDGRIELELPGDAGPRRIDLRVSFLPALTGEAVTVRILRRDQVKLDLGNIDYAPADRARLTRAIESPWGLVVVTGPTGSGKTTILYCCVNHLATPGVKVLSAEDPVEYLLPGVVQVPVRESEGATFARIGRAMLRSDPDVILIGEVRNADTLYLCVQASLTGHLVLTTLHTEDAPSALKRMVEIGVAPFVVADATRLITAQRLVRCLCPDCSRPAELPAEALADAERLARAGGLDWAALPKAFRSPVGCPKCNQTGYRGRTIVAEMLEVTADIGQALRDGAPVDELRRIAVAGGMTTMAADGLRRAAAGQTTIQEVRRVLALR